MKMRFGKKAWTAVLAASMIAAASMPGTVSADSRKVVTIGADLNESQRNSIIKYFGVDLNKVDVIYVTNQDERDHLGSHVPLEQIGTHTISCAYVQPKSSGGIQVKTANFNWVTSNMIASALSTSGVKNCDVIAAAPFEVSGTGALTGAIMAYEAASGETLNKAKKDTAVQEIVTTSQVAETVGQQQATQIVNEIKIQVIESGTEESDEEQIYQIVDAVVGNSMEEDDAVEKVELSDEDREALRVLAESIAAQHYEYEDVKETLERVERNVTENRTPDVNVNVNIDNSNTNTATNEQNNEQTNEQNTNVSQDQTNDQSNEQTAAAEQSAEASQELSDDSILLNTDDSALGEEVIMDATAQEAVPEDAVTIEQPQAQLETEEDSPFEIVTQDEGGIAEDGTDIPAADDADDADLPAADDADDTDIPAADDEFGTDLPAEDDEFDTDIPAADDEFVTDTAETDDTLSTDIPAAEDETMQPQAEDGIDVPAAEESAEAPFAAIGSDSGSAAFDGFAIRIYTEAGLVPASGEVTVRDESGSEIMKADLSSSAAWGAAEVTDLAVLGNLGRDAANCIYVFTDGERFATLGPVSYKISANIVFADDDGSGSAVPGTERPAASLEKEADFMESALTIERDPANGFAAGGRAVLNVALPEGGRAEISSSDPGVAAPEVTEIGGGSESSAEAPAAGEQAVNVSLGNPGEAELKAVIYDGSGQLYGEETIAVAVF
ncbi:MAG: DUF1002 domain-containing protein [Lachnospiraceae bacterium]|nr:DUF1002 domain-containing protein [Lachnospiraceae bacterium]